MVARALTLTCLTAALLAALAPSASAARACPGSVEAFASGPNIVATDIVVVRVGCKPAKRLLRTYFRQVLESAQTPGGCAQRRSSSGCRIGSWTCRTRYVEATNSLAGRCAAKSPAGAKRTVRFAERDIGPG